MFEQDVLYCRQSLKNNRILGAETVSGNRGLIKAIKMSNRETVVIFSDGTRSKAAFIRFIEPLDDAHEAQRFLSKK